MPPKKKRTLQDIKPSKKAVTARKRVAKTKEAAMKTLEKEGVIVDAEPVVKAKPRKRKVSTKKSTHKTSKKSIWMFAGIVVVGFLFAFSLLFSGATATITPKNTKLADGAIMLSAEKNTTEGLSFQTITVSGSRSTVADADDMEPVERKAEGVVTLYNNHSSSSQKLLIDTRLEGSNGAVYKTKEAVTIPGRKTVNGEIVPGQIDVDVYSDLPGEEYDLEVSDFSIIGFKGSAKEDTFFGRSKTPITGGFVGQLHTISEESAKRNQEGLRRLLFDDLKAKLDAQVPEGFVLLHQGVEYITKDQTEYYEGSQPKVEIFEEAELIGIIIDIDNLAEAVATKMITQYEEGVSITIQNIPGLIVKLEDIPLGIKILDSLDLSVTGSVHLVWEIDEDKVRYDLVNIRKKQFNSVMARYEYIDKAKLSLKPFWHSRLPEDVEDIEVEYSLED